MKLTKLIFPFLLVILSTTILFANDFDKDSETSGSEEYLAFADQMPEPVGGLKAILGKVQYPDAAKSANVQGKVYILAFINENGTVDDAKVVMGIGSGCDEEAITAVKTSKFVPAQNGGNAVKVKYSIPIPFTL